MPLPPKKFLEINNDSAQAKRFWSKVNRLQVEEEASPCWDWRGKRQGNGYGVFSFKDQSYLAHRVAYQLGNGAIGEGQLICHTCDNRACCNPTHLFAGSASDNMQDMWSKNRHSRPRLDRAQIEQIRSLYATGSYSQKQLAIRFEIDQSWISRLLKPAIKSLEIEQGD